MMPENVAYEGKAYHREPVILPVKTPDFLPILLSDGLFAGEWSFTPEA